MTDFLPDIFYQDELLSTEAKEGTTIGEHHLWRHVLARLFTDAKGKAGNITGKEKLRVQSLAIQWFTEGGEDFQEVCWMAGLNPDWVRENVMKILRQKNDK